MIDNTSAFARFKGGGRIGYIDAMKGFAILLVVLGHIGIGYYNADVYPQNWKLFYSIYNLIYSFHMPLFFSLSGYVFYTAYFDKNNKPSTARIYSRIENLAAVYFIFGISMGLVKVFAGKLANEETSFLDVALIVIKPLAPYWYLYVLILLYLIFAQPFINKIGRIKIAVMVTLAIICGDFLSIPWFSLSNFLFYLFFFYIGIAHRKYERSIIGNVKITVPLCIVSIIIVIYLWNWEHVISSYHSVNIVVALGIVLTIWYLFENVSWLGNSKLLRQCGRYSLEIYVIHHTLTAGFRAIFPRIGITSAYVSLILNMLLSTSIPILFALCCKRLGIYGLFFEPVNYLQKLKRENF